MTALFHEALYRPLFNLLIFLYNVLPGADFGLAIVALTILVRLLFSPLSLKASRSQRTLAVLNPELAAIKEKFKGDQTAQSQAIMALYKERGINPFSGCLPILIQLPILIALYRALLAGFQPEKLSLLYSFIHNPGAINLVSFGFLAITMPSHILAITAGILQFFQARLSNANMPAPASGDQAAIMTKQMLYFFPVMIIVISWSLPAGLTLYWVTSTLFSIGEQVYIKRLL